MKVVLNFFLGARGRRCVSGNLMFAFYGTYRAPIAKHAQDRKTTHYGRGEERARVWEGKGGHAHASEKQKNSHGEINKTCKPGVMASNPRTCAE